MFAKLRSKIEKSPKIGGKVCAHHFEPRDLKKFKRQYILGARMYMHTCTYINYFRMSLAAKIVKIRGRSP